MLIVYPIVYINYGLKFTKAIICIWYILNLSIMQYRVSINKLMYLVYLLFHKKKRLLKGQNTPMEILHQSFYIKYRKYTRKH